MKPKQPIRSKICHDVRATDQLAGGWHKGWRKPDSETVAFYYRGRWYASSPKRVRPVACASKQEALDL